MLSELEDVKVKRLGLVEDGANGEKFFLLKSGTLAEVDAGVLEKSMWQRIAAVIRKSLNADDVVADSTDATTEVVATTGHVTKSEETPEPTAESSDESSEGFAPADPQNSVEKMAPPTGLTVPENGYAENTENTEMSEGTNESSVAEQIAELAKANNDLRTDLRQAMDELAKAREERERAEFITKAREFSALPVSPSELADHLFWLTKADAERAAWLEGVLRSTNSQLNDMAFYGEIGTTATPLGDSAVAKAAAAADPRAALLALSPEQARSYITEKRREIREVGR